MGFTYEEIVTAIENKEISWALCRRITQLEDHAQILSLLKDFYKKYRETLPASSVFRVFVPGRTFPAISLTGNDCSLNCSHCEGKYLENMTPASDPIEFVKNAAKLIQKGAKGFLLSGGCDPLGNLPFLRYETILQKFKERTEVIYNAHPGLAEFEEAMALARIGVDFLSYDLQLDPKVISEIHHMKDIDPDDYLYSYLTLLDTNIEVVPHILVGAQYGNIDREIDAIKVIEPDRTKRIVFLSLIPPKSNPNFRAPHPLEVAKVILATKIMFPHLELALGCMHMRDSDLFDLERYAIWAGVERLAMPSRAILKWLESENYQIQRYSGCCAMPTHLLPEFLVDKFPSAY